MSIGLYQSSTSTAASALSASATDVGQEIFEEIQQAHRYRVFVQHRGRWIVGCRFASLEQARHTAGLAFRRSELPTQVRDDAGVVLFELRPGIEVDSLVADFQSQQNHS
jgi:hypothetical protein